MTINSKRRRALVGAVTAGAVLLSIAACSTSEEGPVADDDDVTYQVRVAPWQPALDLGFWAAESHGYFEEEGVELDIVATESALASRNALIAGDVNLAHVSLTTSLPVFEAGEPVIAVAAVFQTWTNAQAVTVDFLAGKGYTPEEYKALPIRERYLALEGAEVLGGNPGDISDQVIREQFRLAGVDDLDDFAIVNYLQSQSATEASFLGGRGDVIWAREANVLWYEERGQGVSVADSAEQLEAFEETVLPAGSFLANRDWVEANEEAVEAFLRAWTRGTEWVLSASESELRAWALELNPDVTDEEAREKLVDLVGWLREQASPDGRVDDAVVERVVNFGVETGTLSSKLTVDQVVDWSYLPAVG